MILIRHGQSEFNAHHDRTGRDPGIPDPGLTELGRTQAETAARALRDQDIAALVVSPYRRTLETADIVLRHIDVPVRIDSRVRERAGYSCDVGTVRSMLASGWPHHDFAHLDETWWTGPQEAETALNARCLAFRDELAVHPDWQRTVVVTHWGVIRALTGRVLENGRHLRLPLP